MKKFSSMNSIRGIFIPLSTFPIFAYIIGFVKDFLVTILRTGPVPQHVALIMDGNRRYAKLKNMALMDGHNAGADSLIYVLDTCYRVGVKHITIYAFSIENFNRPQAEVDTLFGLLRDRLKLLSEHEGSYTKFNKVQVRIIGKRSMIPEDILKDLEEIELKTKETQSGMVLNVCFPYTSRDDITYSIQSIVTKIESNEITKDEVNLDMLTDNMYMGPGSPPLDILVRTSGHTRLSDFMLWQCNYNCMVEFTETLWPEFKFLGMMAILLKWSYYKTIQTEKPAITTTKDCTKKKSTTNYLSQLPPPPPFVSVTDR